MYNQSFSGDTATQIEGTNPYEIADKKSNNYYFKKAYSKKSIPVPTEQYEDYEAVINNQQASLTVPLLELESNIIPEETSKPEVIEDPPKVIKKHSFNIYPEMDEKDYSELKNDIHKNGYDPKYPIWLYQGGILDGWNRQMICSELKIKPIYQNFIGNDSDALAFVVRSNHRRNLNSSQRACLAQDYDFLFEKIKKEAKERQIEGGKTRLGKKLPNLREMIIKLIQRLPISLVQIERIIRKQEKSRMKILKRLKKSKEVKQHSVILTKKQPLLFKMN